MRLANLAGLAATAILFLAPTVNAAEAGDWTFRAGPYGVLPKSDNGNVVSVDDGFALGFNFTYHFNSNWALEVLAATPFSHDIDLVGGPNVGETKHLPPTFSLQYHFDTQGKIRPYAGLGVNYTIFFDEETTGPLAGSDLDLDNSFGIAAQIGADFDVWDTWFMNIDIRYIDIETDADLDGAFLETVEIDPWVIGLAFGRQF